MPTVAKCGCGDCITAERSKKRTSGSIGRTAGGIGRNEFATMPDTYKKTNTGKIAGGLTGAAFSLHTLFNPNNCFAKVVANAQKTTKTMKNQTIKTPKTITKPTVIGGVVGASILTGLGILLGGSIDKAVEKAKAIKAEKNLADLEINRNID